jgi:hypothetical protein
LLVIWLVWMRATIEPNEAPSATAAALQALRERRAELDRLASRLDAEGRNTLVEGEADARPMGIGNGPKRPSYNVQTAVDADTGLILHHEVTTEPTDNRLLYPMAAAAKDALAVDALTVVADAGYSNGKDAAACEREGITPCVPANRSINNQGDGTFFDRSAFLYQPDSDTYSCPAGRRLVRKQITRRDNCRSGLLRMCSKAALHDRRSALADSLFPRGCAPADECSR